MEILTRLVKEGHITLDEAFELADKQSDQHMGPMNPPVQINYPSWPYHTQNPLPRIQEPWYQVNDPNNPQIVYFSNPSCKS